MASASDCQSEDEGSIPFSCSIWCRSIFVRMLPDCRSGDCEFESRRHRDKWIINGPNGSKTQIIV